MDLRRGGVYNNNNKVGIVEGLPENTNFKLAVALSSPNDKVTIIKNQSPNFY